MRCADQDTAQPMKDDARERSRFTPRDHCAARGGSWALRFTPCVNLDPSTADFRA